MCPYSDANQQLEREIRYPTLGNLAQGRLRQPELLCGCYLSNAEPLHISG